MGTTAASRQHTRRRHEPRHERPDLELEAVDGVELACVQVARTRDGANALPSERHDLALVLLAVEVHQIDTLLLAESPPLPERLLECGGKDVDLPVDDVRPIVADLLRCANRSRVRCTLD